MARLIDSDCVETFPITIYRGITFTLPWTYFQPNGVTGVDLTGQEIVFKLKFGTTILTYTSTPNVDGSFTEITDASDGEFRILISDEETATFDLTDGVPGRWWIELHNAGNVDLLWADDVYVIDV